MSAKLRKIARKGHKVSRSRRLGLRATCLLAAIGAFFGLLAEQARAEWRRTTEIDWNTAYTLDEGALSVGILSPLQVGISDELQVSIHPILLLVGKPAVGLRYRLGPEDAWTYAVNLTGAWSFIRRVDLDGQEVGADSTRRTGFPGTLQLTFSATTQLGREWLFTAGMGGALDFLGGSAERGLLEFHASAHWLPSARHLVMVQVSTLMDPADGGSLIRPAAQLLYAWAASVRIQVGLGVAFGRFAWESAPGVVTTIPVFPIADMWFRF